MREGFAKLIFWHFTAANHQFHDVTFVFTHIFIHLAHHIHNIVRDAAIELKQHKAVGKLIHRSFDDVAITVMGG